MPRRIGGEKSFGSLMAIVMRAAAAQEAVVPQVGHSGSGKS